LENRDALQDRKINKLVKGKSYVEKILVPMVKQLFENAVNNVSMERLDQVGRFLDRKKTRMSKSDYRREA